MRNNEFDRRRCPFWARMTGWTFIGMIGAVVFALLFGLAAQWLWNRTLVPLFGWPIISYWQTVGLLVLTRLFFGHFGGHHSPHDRTDRFHRFRHFHRDPTDGDSDQES